MPPKRSRTRKKQRKGRKKRGAKSYSSFHDNEHGKRAWSEQLSYSEGSEDPQQTQKEKPTPTEKSLRDLEKLTIRVFKDNNLVSQVSITPKVAKELPSIAKIMEKSNTDSQIALQLSDTVTLVGVMRLLKDVRNKSVFPIKPNDRNMEELNEAQKAAAWMGCQSLYETYTMEIALASDDFEHVISESTLSRSFPKIAWSSISEHKLEIAEGVLHNCRGTFNSQNKDGVLAIFKLAVSQLSSKVTSRLCEKTYIPIYVQYVDSDIMYQVLKEANVVQYGQDSCFYSVIELAITHAIYNESCSDCLNFLTRHKRYLVASKTGDKLMYLFLYKAKNNLLVFNDLFTFVNSFSMFQFVKTRTLFAQQVIDFNK